MKTLIASVLMALSFGVMAAPVATNAKDGYGNTVYSNYEVGATKAHGQAGKGGK